MGTWGTGISSNDTYADVYGEFFELYNDGAEVSEISKLLIDRNQETINDPDDGNNFWFALAMAQWLCGQIDEKLLSTVTAVIDSGSDFDAWRRLGASEKDLQKRATVLSKFLEKLKSSNPKPRARKTKSITQPPFEKGSCLAFKLKNGNYGGAVVLEAKAMKGFGMNLVATTRINKCEMPEMQDFLNAEVLLLNFVTYEDEPEVGWKYSIKFKKDKDLFSLVGRIDVEKEYEPTNSSPYGFGGYWSLIREIASLQFESEETKPKPKKSVRLRELTKHNRWKFW